MERVRYSQIASVCKGRRGGQALLIAVLLMMAILLVGILFVAIVTYNQSSSARHEDMLLAQSLAEAGIRYADHMLCSSPQGADWRPPEPPVQYSSGEYDVGFWGEDLVQGTEDDYYTEGELVRGWGPLRDGTVAAPGGYRGRGFTRYPDPRQPGGTSAEVNNFTLGRGYFLLRVTYDPDPPYEDNDPTPHVADPMSRHIKIESIGRVEEGGQVYRKLVAYKPLPLLNYLRYVTDGTNTGKPAQLGFMPYVDMNNDGAFDTSGTPPLEWLPSVHNGPIKVNSALQVAGAGAPSGAEASAKFNLTTETAGAPRVSSEGYLRDDTLQVAAGIELMDVNLPDDEPVANVPWVAEVSVDSGPAQKLLWSSHRAFSTVGGWVADGQEALDGGGYSRFNSSVPPPSLTLRAEVTGAERYRALTRDSGELVPVGGSYVNNGQWGHGWGIYVDNDDDVQFVQSGGDHDIEALIDDWQRPQSAGVPSGADTDWNVLVTTYSPPGVVVELLPSEAAVGPYSTTLPLSEGEVWWPYHVAGQPGIKLTRYDDTWKQWDGADSGERVMVVDYPAPVVNDPTAPPAHPVIFAEGNVRVKGELPRAYRDPATAELIRSYDLTIVSNATIYIDGQILSPQDIDPLNVRDEDNTKVALLARDCVCLNTTQIVPQLTTGLVSATPDDEENPDDRQQHWELAPGSDGRAYSTWRLGESPGPDTINLVVKQTAGDPGPSGVGLGIWTATSGTYSAYDFGNPDVATTFLFAPPGTLLPSGDVAPQAYCSTAIAPIWEELATSPPTLPALPWDITSYLDNTVGVKNGLLLVHRDPRLSAGSTEYWVKKWKLEQLNGDGAPVGVIGARVNAVVYAERGCWYVLAADYFDSRVTGTDAERFRRYNYKITFNGTIAENFTVRVEAARDWTDKTAYPTSYSAGTLSEWGTIDYIFDETLRVARDQALTTLAGTDRSSSDVLASAQSNLPKLPLLPVSPDLVYYGEAQ